MISLRTRAAPIGSDDFDPETRWFMRIAFLAFLSRKCFPRERDHWAAGSGSSRNGPTRATVIALLGFVLVACAQSREVALRDTAQPAAIATAICLQSRPAESCHNVRLPDPAAEIAYATCLAYNRRDLLRCTALRQAYQADLHAHFAVPQSHAQASGAVAEGPRLTGSRLGDLRRTAEQLYRASNSDADTFQAALLIPEIRRKIEPALGQRLSDATLQALVTKTKAEAVYWYDYMQRLEQGDIRPRR